jgi:hypothetical protein
MEQILGILDIILIENLSILKVCDQLNIKKDINLVVLQMRFDCCCC